MTRHRARRRKQTPGWAWLLVGFGLGLAVAAVVYLRGVRPPPAPRQAAAPAAAQPPIPAPAAKQSPAKPKASSPESQFDFYDILPQYEVVVPATGTSSGGSKLRTKPIEEPGSYMIQAGSFNGFADADRLKAKLALLGIEASIQRVTIDDDVFHRVRVGPITDLAELNRVRRQLRDAGIDPMLMKAPQ
jgi:cell division protein FtsN